MRGLWSNHERAIRASDPYSAAQAHRLYVVVVPGGMHFSADPQRLIPDPGPFLTFFWPPKKTTQYWLISDPPLHLCLSKTNGHKCCFFPHRRSHDSMMHEVHWASSSSLNAQSNFGILRPAFHRYTKYRKDASGGHHEINDKRRLIYDLENKRVTAGIGGSEITLLLSGVR